MCRDASDADESESSASARDTMDPTADPSRGRESGRRRGPPGSADADFATWRLGTAAGGSPRAAGEKGLPRSKSDSENVADASGENTGGGPAFVDRTSIGPSFRSPPRSARREKSERGLRETSAEGSDGEGTSSASTASESRDDGRTSRRGGEDAGRC